MSNQSQAIEALKKATKELMAARTYTAQCEQRYTQAHKEEQEAQSKYNTVLHNLRANLELEVTQEMTDQEFQQAGVV